MSSSIEFQKTTAIKEEGKAKIEERHLPIPVALERIESSHAQPIRDENFLLPFEEGEEKAIYNDLKNLPPICPEKISNKVFAHIHGNAFIAKSELEGSTITNNIQVLTPLLDKLNQEGKMKTQLFEKIASDFKQITANAAIVNGAEGLSLSAKNLKKQLSDLRIGETLLIPGGWTGIKRGHAMLYQFTKKPSQKIDLMVLNTGGGAQFHASCYSHLKEKIDPILAFESIPEEELHADFFVALIQKQRKDFGENDQKGAEITYKSLFSPLSKYKKPLRSLPLKEFMTAQRSGVCSMRVVFALLFLRGRESGSDQSDYKRLKFWIKFYSLLQFFEENKSNLQSGELRALLKEAAESLMTTSGKIIKGGRLGDECTSLDLKKALTLSHTVLEAVKEADKNIEVLEERVDLKPKDPETLTVPPLIFSTYSGNLVAGSLSSCSLLSFKPGENFKADILKCLNNVLEKDGEARRTQIELFIREFPIPEQNKSHFLDQFGTEEKMEIVKNLLELLNFYVRDFQLKNSYCLSYEKNTALKLFIYIHYLVTKLEEADPNLPKFSGEWSFKHIGASKDSRELFFSAKDLAIRNETLSYFSSSGKENTFIDKKTISPESRNEKTAITDIFNNYENEIEAFYAIEKNRSLNWDLNHAPKQVWALAELYADFGKVVEKSFFASKGWDIPLLLKQAAYLTNSIFNEKFTCCFDIKAIGSWNLNYFEYIASTTLQEDNSILMSLSFLPRDDLRSYSNFRGITQGASRRIKVPGKNLIDTFAGKIPDGSNIQIARANYACNEGILRLPDLLSYYEENIELLEDRNHQTYFVEQFFKASIPDQEIEESNRFDMLKFKVPFDLIEEDRQAFKEKFLKFIEMGKFFNFHENKPIKLVPLLFFIRIASMVLPYFNRKEDEAFFESLTKEILEINSYLKDETLLLSEEEKTLIHIERLRCYEMVSSFRSITQDELVEIVESWFHFTSVPPKVEDSEKFHDRLVRRFAARFLSEVPSFKEVVNRALVSRLKRLGIEGEGSWEEERVRPNFVLEPQQKRHNFIYKDKEGRKLFLCNIVSGAICKRSDVEDDKWEMISFDIDQDQIYNSKQFQELFGNKRFSFFSKGSLIHFVDEEGREFRVDISRSSKNSLRACYEAYEWFEPHLKKWLPFSRKTAEGKISSAAAIYNAVQNIKNVENGSIFKAILADHHLFLVPPEMGADRYILTNKELTPEFEVEGKHVYRIDANLKRSSEIFQIDEMTDSLTKRFETKGFVFFEKELDGERKEYLNFPRYKDDSGRLLRFEKNKTTEKFHLESDPRFTLVTNLPNAEIHGLTSFLLIENLQEAKKRKVVLVPKIPYENEAKKLSSGTQLDVSDKNTIDPNDDESFFTDFLKPKWGSREFVRFSLKGDDFVDNLSSEESLFASYLWFGQKRYEKAIFYLNRVVFSDIQSEKSLELLDQIIDLGEKLQDKTVYAEAVSLHALYLRLKYSCSKGAHSERISEVCKKMLHYVSEISRVKQSLRLSYEKESYLLIYGDHPILQERQKELRKRGQLVISHFQEGPLPINELECKIPDHVKEQMDIDYTLDSPKSVFDLEKDITLLERLYDKRMTDYFFIQIYQLAAKAKFESDTKTINRLRFIFADILTSIPIKDHDRRIYLLLGILEAPNRTAVLPWFTEGREFDDRTERNFENWYFDFKWHYTIQNTVRVRIGEIAASSLMGHDVVPTQNATLDNVIYPLEEEEQETLLLSVENAPQMKRWQRVFQEGRNLVVASFEEEEVPFTQTEEFLEEALKGALEKEKEEHVKRGLADFLACYEKRKTTRSKSKVEIDPTVLDEKIEASKEILIEMKNELSQLANRGKNEGEILVRSLSIVSGNQKILAFHDLVKLFSQRSPTLYKYWNPSLTDDEIKEIFHKTAECLYAEVTLHHLKHIRRGLQKVKASDNQTIALRDFLPTLYQDTPLESYEEEVKRLVFEWQQKIRFRKNPDQIADLRHMGKSTNAIDVVPMGGGKTSVIIANLLATSRKGGIPILVTPSFQFQTIYESLRKTLKDAFDMDIFKFDYKREELTQDVLNHIHNTLLDVCEASKYGTRKAVIVCPEMLQILKLEFFSAIRQLKKIDEGSISYKTQKDRIRSLAYILKLIKQDGDAIGDELQTLFNINHEVNLAIGAPLPARSEFIDLLKSIFAVIGDKENHKISVPKKLLDQSIETYEEKTTCYIEDLLKMSENQQVYFDGDDFKTYIAPEIGKLMAAHYAPLGLKGEQREDFAAYILGEIAADSPFMVELERLGESKDQKELVRADLIALTKHLLNDVLPIILKKSGNINYGRTKDEKEVGKVKPYIAASTEAPTQFGYHYEAAGCQLATVMQYGISKEQLIKVAIDRWHNEAIWFVKNKRGGGVSYKDTPSAKECLAQYGYLPSEIKEHADEVIEGLTFDQILDIEKSTIDEYVRIYPERLTSNFHAFFNMFRSFKATGGTADEYVLPIPMLEREENKEKLHMIDRSINPNVIHTLFAKAGENSIHEIDLPKIKEVGVDALKGVFREMLLWHTEKERVSSILDAGGILKDFDSIMLGKALLATLSEDKAFNHIKAVSFFCRANGSHTADYFAIIKRGSTEPIILKDTSEGELLKHGLKPSDLFSLYDQRHCIGTDIKQPANGIGIMTFDKGLTVDMACQAIMRLRQFLLGQEISFIIPKVAARKMRINLNQTGLSNIQKTLFALFLEMNQAQVTLRANDLYRNYKKALYNTLYQKALSTLLQLDDTPGLIKYLDGFSSVLFLEAKDSPYALFGSLEKEVDVIESLKTYAKQIRDKLLTRLTTNTSEAFGNEVIAACEKEHEKILQEAEKQKSRFFPLIKEAGNSSVNAGLDTDRMNISMEVAVDTNVDQDIDQNTNINIELKQELGLYQSHQNLKAKKYLRYTDSQIENFLKLSGEEALNKPLQERLKGSIYKKPYHKVFPSSNLAISERCARPYEQEVAVFASEMPPFDHILYTKKEGEQSKVTLISQAEAAQFKAYLIKNKNAFPNISLLKPNGLIEAGQSFKQDPELENFLLQVNFLEGNVDYLFTHSREFLKWMYEGVSEEVISLRQDFLKMRVEPFKYRKPKCYKYLLSKETLEKLHEEEDRIPPPKTSVTKKCKPLKSLTPQLKSSKVERVGYTIMTLVLPIFSLIFILPVELIYWGGRICRLRTLKSAHDFLLLSFVRFAFLFTCRGRIGCRTHTF